MIERAAHTRRAFTLPIVMVAMVALVTLSIGLLLLVVLAERSTRAHSNAERANDAAASAFAEVRAILGEHTANDDYFVLRAPVQVAPDGDGDGVESPGEQVPRPYLFLARGESAGDGFSYRYEPLFSTQRNPERSGTPQLPEEAGLPDGSRDRVALRALPFEEAPVLAWRTVADEDGRPAFRYAFWLEDMEAYLDASVVGNTHGDERHARFIERWPDHWPTDTGVPLPYPARADYLAPFHAPGLNPSADSIESAPLDQIALYTLSPGGAQEDRADFDDRIMASRDFLFSDDSLLAAVGVPVPLQRDRGGRLVNDVARTLEENLASGNEPYDEQALIPSLPGLDASMAGMPKLNLNAMLELEAGEAVETIATHIERAFPGFEERKGGFGEDYPRTLAANILDYADRDGQSTRSEGIYRGIDSYSLTSEFLVRYKWEWEGDPHDQEGVLAENGRKYMLLTVAVYAELWNMNNHPVSGSVQFEYETNFTMSLGAQPMVHLMDEEILNRSASGIDATAAQSGSRHQLGKDSSGRWYFPPQAVTLEPNEYRVIKAGDVRYKLDAGLETMWVASPILLEGDDAQSGYRLKWNGQVVDRSGGNLERTETSLNFPKNTKAHPRQKVRGTIPGQSFGAWGKGYSNGMGDPRIAYYAAMTQAQSSYPRNYSPSRRNVRVAIFRGGKNKIWGRVLPSEWPDGGHDASFGDDSFYTTDQRLDPDDPRFEAGKPPPEPWKAPMRISNLGVFFSETELGHIWDPIMWGSKHDPVTGKKVRYPARSAWARHVENAHFTSPVLGGGNTLRIGRPEHPRFDRVGLRAAGLLDLFHCGLPGSADRARRTGPVVRRHGHVNLNTAPREVLRALAAGWLAHDPALARATSLEPDPGEMAPPTTPIRIGAPTLERAADLVADAIIFNRPYVSPAQLSAIKTQPEPGAAEGYFVFGNRGIYSVGRYLQWSDAAAEEVFARVYNSATVRSRNFRIHVIGQAVRETASGRIKVLATRRKQFRVFVDPGERDDDGGIDPGKLRIKLIYEKES